MSVISIVSMRDHRQQCDDMLVLRLQPLQLPANIIEASLHRVVQRGQSKTAMPEASGKKFVHGGGAWLAH